MMWKNESAENAQATRQIPFATKQRIVLLFGGIAIFGLLCLVVPNFSTAYNLFNVITQASIYGTMSMGLAFVLITSGIDISLPYVMTMGAVVGVTYIAQTGNGVIGCILIVVVCMLAGLINGISVSTFNMPPMIVTLAMMNIAEGFAKWYTNYESVRGIPKGLSTFFKTRVLDVIPVYAVVFLVIVIILSFVLSKTVYGRWLYCIGTNKNTARVSGVPVRAATITAYVISSMMAGIAGIMLSVQSNCATARMASPSMLLEILAAAIIGGASDKGGRGTILGVALGAIVISATSISLNLLGIQPYPAQVIKGLIIILATILDYYTNRKH